MFISIYSKIPLYSKLCINRNFINNVNFFTNVKRFSHSLDINTKVIKDVILYKYENPRHFKYLNLFGVSQLGFWMYLSYITYTTLRDAPVPEEGKEELSLWRRVNLGENKYRNAIAMSCAFVGYAFFLGAIAYTIRSVRFLVLRKGGKTVSFVTYGPLGRNLIMDVPIERISAKESRERAKVALPIKIDGKSFHYMLDMKGQFLNQKLFDATAGLHRNFRK